MIPTDNMQAYEYYLRGMEIYESAVEVKDAKKAARLMQGEELAVLYDGVGYLYLSMGMYDEATIYYQMSIDILPSWQSNSAQWWLNLIQGKFEDALIFAQRNVELYPEDNRSHLELARTYAHM